MIWEIKIDSPFLSMKGLLSESHLLELKVDPFFVEEKEVTSSPLADELRSQLKAYFAGKLQTFDIPYQIERGSPFQRACWEILCQIPYGQTISYKEQAIRLGDIKKLRAVGGANGKNPISLIIPCHRVIGTNGTMRGYSTALGQNTNLKKNLLLLEKNYQNKIFIPI